VQQGPQSSVPPHPSGCGPQTSTLQVNGVQPQGGQFNMPPHPSGCVPQTSTSHVRGVQVPVPAQKMAQASPESADLSPSWNMT